MTASLASGSLRSLSFKRCAADSAFADSAFIAFICGHLLQLPLGPSIHDVIRVHLPEMIERHEDPFLADAQDTSHLNYRVADPAVCRIDHEIFDLAKMIIALVENRRTQEEITRYSPVHVSVHTAMLRRL